MSTSVTRPPLGAAVCLLALLATSQGVSCFMGSVSSETATDDPSINIAVDPRRSLAMGNAAPRFDRSAFVNVHGMVHASWTPDQAAMYGDGNLSAAFGRAINRPIWLWDQNRKLQPSGGLNVTELAQQCVEYPETVPAYKALFTSEADQLQYIESLNVNFWYEKNPHPKSWNPATSRGFYPEGNTTEMGDLYTGYLSVCVDATTQGSIIVECMNEPDVHAHELNITMQDIIDGHIGIARAVHGKFGRLPPAERGPSAPSSSSSAPIPYRVAGPTAAWPEFQFGGNFSYFRKMYGDFIEQAGPDMDLLSVHLYDTYLSTASAMDANGPWNASSWAGRRIGGNIAAILDLIETVSAERQQRRGGSYPSSFEPMPMEVSEYGTSFKNWKTEPGFNATDRGYWAILIGVCGKTLEFIDRADTIVKAVPFMIHDGAWNKGSPAPFTLFAPPHWRDPTALTLWYEMWRGVAGTRVWSSGVGITSSSSTSNQSSAGLRRTPLQQVVALASNTTLFVLLNNLDAWPTPFVTLALPVGGTAAAATGTKRTLHWSDEQDAPAIAREDLHIDNGSSGVTVHLRSVPPNAFVVVEIPMVAESAVPLAPTRRWRLNGVWNAAGGVTAFPTIAPKDARNPDRRRVRTTVDVTRALAAASASSAPDAAAAANVSITGIRLCFSSYAGTPDEYASNVPQLGFVDAATPSSVAWIQGAQATFAGHASRSPDERSFTCIDYNTQASPNVHVAFEAALSAATVGIEVRVGSGQEPDLELSSLVIVAETQ